MSEKVSFVETKRLGQLVLPHGSPLRSILLTQPDLLPRSEALPQIELFIRMLFLEVGKA